MKRIVVFIGLLMVLLPSQAQTEEQVVQSIKDDIQAVKAKTRETRNLLREQERDLRKLTTELERTRVTIQQNKQRERNAKKSGKSFTPKPVERTYISRFGHDKAEAKPATPERKTERKVEQKKPAGETPATNKKEEKQPAKAAPANNRRISDKEALRQQKQRNDYYENRLKEKQKAAKAAEKKAAKEAAQAEKEKKQAEKEAEKLRKKMEKEKRKTQAPVASARRVRDSKSAESTEEPSAGNE